MEWLRSWICGICAAAILVSVAYAMAPKNSAGHFVRLSGAVIIILAVLAPFKQFKIEAISPYIVRYNLSYENLTENLQAENEKIQSLIIEDKMSTYILQRAQEIGVSCEVTVSAGKSEDGYLYPASAHVVLDAATPEKKRLELMEIIEQECAIPDQAQTIEKREG